MRFHDGRFRSPKYPAGGHVRGQSLFQTLDGSLAADSDASRNDTRRCPPPMLLQSSHHQLCVSFLSLSSPLGQGVPARGCSWSNNNSGWHEPAVGRKSSSTALERVTVRGALQGLRVRLFPYGAEVKQGRSSVWRRSSAG